MPQTSRYLSYISGPMMLVWAAGTAFAGQMVPPADNSREIKAVLELFTSQGCSSCPPADALLKKYAEDKSYMAMSLPIDYWDYIGWKDTFANRKNTDRQRAYARAFGKGSIYTPQIVVNGTAQAAGSDKAAIDAAIEQSSEKFQRDRIPVRFWRHESILNIDLGTASTTTQNRQATVWFVVLQKQGEVAIKLGENSGRTLNYTNIVRELVPVGIWEGAQKSFQVSTASVIMPENEELAVLVQDVANGSIIGAAFLNR